MKRAAQPGIAAITAVMALLVADHAAAAPKRIASINVCTDQLLLSIADAEQIFGLSPYATSGSQSWFSDQAKRFRKLSGEAEDILLARPDLIVAGSFTKQTTRELLTAQGLPVETFDVAWTIDDAKAQIIRMGELTGHADRAHAMVARLETAIARASSIGRRTNYRVLPLSRRGWVTGGPSLISSLLEISGLKNAATELGVGSGGFASLEAIITLKPDLLVVTTASEIAEDEGRAFLLHPALAKMYPPDRRIIVPEQYTVCAGPMLIDALDRISHELELLEQRKTP